MTGERLGQAGWLNPSRVGPPGSAAQAGFTSSSGGVRAPSVMRKGTARPGAMRNRPEPSEVPWRSFDSRRKTVTQRVFGCYCVSARAKDSGGLGNEVSQRKDAERRDKVSVRTGEDTRSRQDP